MNRRGDCICAIPSYPPERHHPLCPIRRRVEAEGAPEAPHLHPRCPVCGHDHPGIGGCITAHAFVKREHCRACRFSQELSGAGGDQAPREAPEARPGATGERPRPDAGTPAPSHPTPPLGPSCRVCGVSLTLKSPNVCEACPEHPGSPPVWPTARHLGGPPKGGA